MVGQLLYRSDIETLANTISSTAKNLLCNMTHRGAVGSDTRDGDGAGVMTSIPHKFFQKEFEYHHQFKLPPPGQYAVGNIFFKPGAENFLKKNKSTFEEI